MTAYAMAEQVLGEADYALVIAGTHQLPLSGIGYGCPLSSSSSCNSLKLIPGATVWQTTPPRMAPPPLPVSVDYGWNCWICKSTSHFKRQCPRNPYRIPPEDILCWQCERHGHYSWQCLTPEWVPTACHECGVLGHFAKECPILSLPRYSCEIWYIHGMARGTRQVYVDVEGRVRCKEGEACPKVIANAD